MWETYLKQERNKDYFKALERFLDVCDGPIYPIKEDRFNAYRYTPYEAVKVVILGQDPYHQPGQAMGLSFSVHQGTPLPKSLINIYKELADDVGVHKLTGDLSGWAKQGVFLLNTLLSVEESKPLSHQNKGWETFTDGTIKLLSERKEPMIFVLWGKNAQLKKALIGDHHVILEAPHPSPLSSYRGFFGSKPFSQTTQYLIAQGKSPIDWQITDL